MRMHGCVIGFEHFGHGRHGFGHRGPHHRPHRGPHLGPHYGAFVPRGKFSKGEPGPFGPVGGTPGLYDRFVDDNGFEWRLHLPGEDESDCEGGKTDSEALKPHCEESGKSDCENGKAVGEYGSSRRRRCWGKRGGRHEDKGHHGRKHMGHHGHNGHRGREGEGNKSRDCCKCGKPRAVDMLVTEPMVETRDGETTRAVQDAPTAPVSLVEAEGVENETV